VPRPWNKREKETESRLKFRSNRRGFFYNQPVNRWQPAV